MVQNYFDAIGFDENGKAYKYRNVKKDKYSIAKFEKFCQQTTATKYPFVYVNYYDKKTKNFSHRVYFNQ